MYRTLISHLFHEANDKIFYFETSPASQCHYTQRLVNKSRYLHSDPICAIESCPETCLPSNSCFTRASPLEFVPFAIEFVGIAIEFVGIAIEFVPFSIEFVAFAVELVGFAIEFVAFALQFVINKTAPRNQLVH